MLRYRLRTLLILLALGPPAVALAYHKYSAWKAERERLAQRMFWMVSSPPPGGYADVPKTVGEWEAQKRLGRIRSP
jgi:hypothetical protein